MLNPCIHRAFRVLTLLLAAVLIGVAVPAPSGGNPTAIPAVQADDDDDDDGDDGHDGDQGGINQTRPRINAVTEGPPPQSGAVSVEVNCSYDPSDDRSTCEFIPDARPDRARGIQIPVASVCAPVVSGDLLADVPLATYQTGASAFANRPGATGVVLILDGIVSTSGATAYAVQTSAGWIVADGPGLSCGGRTGSTTGATGEQLGAITVRAHACPVAKPLNGEAFDWHAECSAPAPGLAIQLSLDDREVAMKSIVGDKNGAASFRDLTPGTYRLDLIDGIWCHAEADRVNASGEVEVEAGQRSTVWIFLCGTGRT